MKKYILSLFALLAFLTPVVGLSANGLTDPGTVDGEKQSPLYRLFYKEHRISSNDSTAYVDSDGTEYSFNDIFENGHLNLVSASLTQDSTYDSYDTETGYLRGYDYSVESYALEFTSDISIDASNDVYVYAEHYTFDGNWKMEFISSDDNTEYIFKVNEDDAYPKQTSIININDEVYKIRIARYNSSGETNLNNYGYVDMEKFETDPSESSMDTYLDVYLTVEEGETYYYYTFDGGFISILWIAVLFSGSYLYIRKAEVEDTKQAMVQASIFFIIGLVLLRVIQTVI